jgi:hypothetical protein
MLEKAELIRMICEREAFDDSDDSGCWAEKPHDENMYAAWRLGRCGPLAAHRGGKWYCHSHMQFTRDLALALRARGEEVVEVTLSELCEFIHSGEPPTPPEVKALLSVSAD